VKVLDIKKKCLLSKWLYKLLNKVWVWQELLHNKYLHSHTLSHFKVKLNDSPFWEGLIKDKEGFFFRGSFNVGNNLYSRFWEDSCLGNKPLAQQYSSLYNISQHKKNLVANVLSEFPMNIFFRRASIANRWTRWLHFV
jgi:hypothetical protein